MKVENLSTVTGYVDRLKDLERKIEALQGMTNLRVILNGRTFQELSYSNDSPTSAAIKALVNASLAAAVKDTRTKLQDLGVTID